jgi:hypothetical protein
MSDNENIEVFTSEFRHETVKNFIEDLLAGKINLMFPPEPNSELGTKVTEQYVSMSMNIQKFVSGEERNNLNELERKIFSDILIMRITGAIIEKDNRIIDDEIQKVSKRLDSTNNLLHQIILVLQEVIKRLDR